MEPKGWLTKDQIITIAAELVNSNEATPIPQKLTYLYNQYAEANGLQLFDKILDTLSGFLRQIDKVLVTMAKEVDLSTNDGSGIEISLIEKKEDEWKVTIQEMTYDERIIFLRKMYGYNRYVLYGPTVSNIQGVTGIRGSITWNEVNDIHQLVLDYKRGKEEHPNKVLAINEPEIGKLAALESSDDPKGKNSKIIRKHLEVFGGKNIYGQKIMALDDYERLLLYVEDMVNENKVPESVVPVSKIKLTNKFIRYTFYLIHLELYSNRTIFFHFADFIHKFFKQFTGEPEVTRSKLSTPIPEYEKEVHEMSRLSKL